MYFTVLEETKEKVETVIDFDEILCFNEVTIVFKNDVYLPSCKEWYKHLKELKKWRKPNEKRNA